MDLCPRPFKGVVLCATGMVDKVSVFWEGVERVLIRLQPTLFKQAVELGATATTALTDKVTHLVAVDHGGAKYLVRV